MSEKDFFARVDRFVLHNGLWTDNNRLLLGLSGGLDSMVLAHYLKQKGLDFAVAHVNFQLRGEDADNDSRFVYDWCSNNGIMCHIHSEDTLAYVEREKVSVEEAARDIRYRFFYHLSYAHSYHRILTAHHGSDNLETTILHLVRGAGIRGMQGIPVQNHRVVRPFLFLSRSELIEWAKLAEISYREDLSNQDRSFSRNRIRHDVIPIFRELNPSLEVTFSKSNQLLKEAAYLATISLEKTAKKICRVSENDVYISKNSLRKHPAAWSVLYHILGPLGYSSDLCRQILEHMDGSGKWVEAGQMRLLIDRKDLIITSGKQEAFSWNYIGELDRKIHLPKITLEFRYSENKQIVRSDNNIAFIDVSKLQYPLLIRPWKKGDYFYPAGMYKTNGKPAKKKVSDLLVDNKKSLLQKERTFLLISGEQIVWIIGLRQDERFKVNPQTRTLLKVKILPKKESIYY